MNTNDAFCHIHLVDKESKQICLSVSSFTNLCTFIIRKNKVFPRNSDENIYFSFCSGFHVHSKASANIIGQRDQICQGNATHNRTSIVLVNVSSFFLLFRLSSHRHVQQREHCSQQPSLVITQQHSSSQIRLNMTPHRTKRIFQHLPSRHKTQRGEATALTAPQSRVREADVQRCWSRNRRADCACPQAASPHHTAASDARCVQVQQDTVWSGAAAHVQVDAVSCLARKALCDVCHLGVEDGCVAQRQRATCSVLCSTKCEYP